MIEQNNIVKLKSYSTIVAKYNKETKKMNVYGWYTSTTAGHINAFLNHFGFDAMNKKQMENAN